MGKQGGNASNIDSILYGIGGSDLDENDLYYRGGVKQNISDEMNGAMDEDMNGNGRGGGHRMMMRRNDSMRGQWRNRMHHQQIQHLDLDYTQSYGQDKEINADSYNLEDGDD